MYSKHYFMHDQARSSVASIMSDHPARAVATADLGGAGLALVVAALTLLNLLAVAPGA